MTRLTVRHFQFISATPTLNVSNLITMEIRRSHIKIKTMETPINTNLTSQSFALQTKLFEFPYDRINASLYFCYKYSLPIFTFTATNVPI